MSPGCESGQIHEDADAGPIMTCNHCGFKSCVIHQMPFHEGETCSQYDDRMNRMRAELQREQQGSLEPSEQSSAAGMKRKRSYVESDNTEPREQQRFEQQRFEQQRLEEELRRMEEWVQKEERRREEERLQQEERKRAREKLLEEMASKGALTGYLRCPGENCGYMVHKIAGCDHMTCEIPLDKAHSYITLRDSY
jgi:hypothetical protein